MKKLKGGVMVVVMIVSILTVINPVSAAEFHVTNAAEFQNALDTAESNGEDDTIYLTAGTYLGNFHYGPPDTENRSLTITGEPGTSASDIILDGQNSGRVLTLYDWSLGPVAEITITGITVQNGNSSQDGGGIYAALYSHNIVVTNCIIRNNIAQEYGGGAYLDTNEDITVENNVIIDNTVTEEDSRSRGGGVAMLAPHETYTVRNNIVARNTAQGATDPQGGGLWIGWLSDDITHLTGNTIYNNTANTGGGVYINDGGTANVYNNIVYANTAAEGGDIYFSSVTNRIGHNNDYSDMYGTWTDSGDNLDTDPLLVDPANNDFHLQPTSPMIDTGTTAVPSPGIPATDFEGDSRIFGVAPDIGADEYIPQAPVGPAINPIAVFLPLRNYHLAQVNTCLGCIEENLSDDVPQDVQALLDEMQMHIDNANTTGNTIYANNELLKALNCCEEIQEKLGITCPL